MFILVFYLKEQLKFLCKTILITNGKGFLGGTVNDSKQRDEVIPKLTIDYFDPVVENWDEAAYQREIKERKTCDFCLYVITPKIEGYYSIAEAVDDSNKRPEKTVYCILEKDDDTEFTTHQLKSVKRVGELVARNGGQYFNNLDDVVKFINTERIAVDNEINHE